MSKDCEHCWHEQGGTSYGSGGRDVVKCCHCGFRGERAWTAERVRVPGHGKYHYVNERQFGNVKISKSNWRDVV